MSNHRIESIFPGVTSTFFDEHSEHITFRIRVFLLHKRIQFCAHSTAPHIRRIGNYCIVFLRHKLGSLNQRQQVVQHTLFAHTDVIPHLIKTSVKSSKIHWGNVQDRTVLLGILHFVDNTVHRPFQLGIAFAKVFQSIFVNIVAFSNCIDVGLNLAAEKTAVILASFHHHRKIGKLSRTVINIQTVKVIFHDALHCFTGGVAVALVNLHQHVK